MLPDSPMSAVSASPGMTRMSPKTITDDSSSTGTASRTRRSTYLYIRRSPRRRLLIQPRARQRGRAVAVRAPQRRRRRVAHVRLEDHEAVVVGHPQPQGLVELAIHDLLGERPLLGDVGRLPQLERELVEDRIVDPKEVLRRLRVQVLVGPLVDADGVTGLEPPRHAVPLVVDVAAVVGRVVELGDLDV